LPRVSNGIVNQVVYGFGVNSSIGTQREYNEDRYLLIENASMPESCSAIQAWKKINLFGVLDGHGGSRCVEYV
jgi:serine/threonine protein phosphatase PrpC